MMEERERKSRVKFNLFFFFSSALAVQIYLQMDRLDLARNEVATVKTWAEDALLLQMMEAWVDLRVVSLCVLFSLSPFF